MNKNQAPVFRADHVRQLSPSRSPQGSAWPKREKGAISQAELKVVEDREIEKIVAKAGRDRAQASRPTAEFRRSWWHFDFSRDASMGWSCTKADQGIQFPGSADQGHKRPFRIGRQSSASPNHPMVEHFKFLKSHTRLYAQDDPFRRPPVLHFRLAKGWHQQKKVYPGISMVSFHEPGRGPTKEGGVESLLRCGMPLPTSVSMTRYMGLSLLAGGSCEKGARAHGRMSTSFNPSMPA